MTRIKEIGYVFSYMRDPDASSKWYCEVLGMEAVIEQPPFPACFLSFGRRDHDIARFKGRGEGAAKPLWWMSVFFNIFPYITKYLPNIKQLNGRVGAQRSVAALRGPLLSRSGHFSSMSLAGWPIIGHPAFFMVRLRANPRHRREGDPDRAGKRRRLAAAARRPEESGKIGVAH
jgi:hypothetical protein